MLMLMIDTFRFNKTKDIKNISVVITSYLIIVAILAQILKTNYHGMYHGSVAFIENIRMFLVDNIGFIGQLSYIVCVIAISVLFTIVSYFFTKIVYIYINKLKNLTIN